MRPISSSKYCLFWLEIHTIFFLPRHLESIWRHFSRQVHGRVRILLVCLKPFLRFLVKVFVGYSEIFSDYDSSGVQLCFYIIENPPTGSPLNMEDTKKDSPPSLFYQGLDISQLYATSHLQPMVSYR